MELEEAIEILKRVILVNNFESYSSEGIIIEAIEVLLNHLTKQEKMIDELKNKVHYQNCINCGKEIRTKRKDAKYCDECVKIKQKEYFKNMSDYKKKQRAEKSKMYMRELRARKKAEE